jgi:hypothetical protein
MPNKKSDLRTSTTTTWRLTKRGKRLRALLIAGVAIYVIYKLFDITTPEVCKHKPIEQLSQYCIDLLYPH